ncbi:MAG: type I pullulanase [Ruminococcus sp.]|nr:type I pullulanase [Ruminococcus sp.]
MKKTKKLISLLLCAVLVASMMSVAIVSTSAATNPYSDAAMALDQEYAYDGELGAIYSPEATTFKVWAPLATEVKLNRYATGSDDEEGAQDLGTTGMEKLMDGDKWTGVWTTTVEGDIVNTYYTYSITNPNHIYNGTTEITHETEDVYSYAVGVNGNRSMVVDLTTAETNPEGWESDSHVFTDQQTDAIIWEVHVKDFTYAPNSGVSDANRGKFLGFTETGTTLDNKGVISTGIDYLKNLGVTHVQINPMYDFATIDESGDDSQFNWGYDPKNYGVPEGSYSSNPYDGNVRIKEAKAMIQALHNAGIGVIMDVVYNHTYSVDSCFNYSVPEYYYRMTADGGYSQQSGCGNDTASERAMYRKYMRDMISYWVNEYHIDGLRFDLMGVHDGETMNMIRDDMDDIDSRIVMYGEGWAGDTVYDPTTCAGTATFMTTQGNSDKLSTRIGFFNDQIRDAIKGNVFHKEEGGFVQNVKTSAPGVNFGIRANTVGKSRWHAVTPEQCLTYASCHDNYTLYDKLAYVDQNGTIANYRQRFANVVAQNKLTGAIISTSQGMDFLLAGEEMGRSKDGDENSYKSAATLNMIDWSLLETNADIVSYYRGLFELRKVFSPFTANVTEAAGGNYKYNFDTSATGSVNPIAYTIDNNTEGEWSKIAVIYNGANIVKNYRFTKASSGVTDNSEWVIVVNDKQAGVQKLGEVKGRTFTVPAYSAMIAVEKSTFEETAIPSDFSTLTVNSVYDVTGETLTSSTLIGKPGEGYSVTADGSIPLQYELDRVEGDETGVFSDEEQTVTYHYRDYVPERFTAPDGDLNDDGVVDIIDVTVLQRHLAYLNRLDAEHEKRGDYDLDGVTDSPDVTLLQRFCAGMIAPVYTVTTRYLGRTDDGTKSIATATVQTLRYGDSYTTEPLTIAYYKLDETPANASGTVNKKTVVTYWYSYSVASPVMHVKHSGDETWDPNLWAWAYDGSGQAINCYEETGWPGKTLTNPDENGWYNVTFPIPGGLNYYFIISQGSGTPQTMDYGRVNGEDIGISYDDYPEIWVVIQDDLIGKNNGDWCKYYNYNPDLES